MYAILRIFLRLSVNSKKNSKNTGPVLTKILRIFLRITLKSKKNSLLRIFLFLE